MRSGRRLVGLSGAFVCLAFVACGGDDGSGSGSTPDTGTTGVTDTTAVTGTTGTTGVTGVSGVTGTTEPTGPTGPPVTTGVVVDLEQYPACALVTLEELAQETGTVWVNGPQAPPSPDQPFCSWDSDSDPSERAHLQISVVPRSGFVSCTISPSAEAIRGLGDRAVIDVPTRRMCVLSGDRYLSISLSFFPERNDYVEVATAIAERALPRLGDVLA